MLVHPGNNIYTPFLALSLALQAVSSQADYSLVVSYYKGVLN